MLFLWTSHDPRDAVGHSQAVLSTSREFGERRQLTHSRDCSVFREM